jgi:ATP-dependent helicase HrpA
MALPDALRVYLQHRLGQPLPADLERCRPPLRICNERDGHRRCRQELAAGRDLAALRAKLGDAAQLSLAAMDPAFERKGLRQWDFGDLPESLTFTRDGQRLTGYPALVDEGNGIARAARHQGSGGDWQRALVSCLLRIALRDALALRQGGAAAGFAQPRCSLKPRSPRTGCWPTLDAGLTRAFLSDDPLPRTERGVRGTDQARGRGCRRSWKVPSGCWQRSPPNTRR